MRRNTAGLSRSWSNSQGHAVLFACHPCVYFHTCSLMFVCYVNIMRILGDIVHQNSAETNLTQGVVRVVDNPTFLPVYLALFLWPKWTGLWAESRWDEVLMCSLLSCQPFSLPVYLVAVGLSWACCVGAWWLLADCPLDRGGADLMLSPDLHSDLWVPLCGLSRVPLPHPTAFLLSML